MTGSSTAESEARADGPLLVQVSQHFRPVGGGQEVYIENLVRVMAAAGWRNLVIQPYRGVRTPDIAPVPRIPGVARLFPGFEDWQFAVLSTLLRATLLNRATVILCHYAATAAWIGRVARWRRKLIVLSHGVEWNVDTMGRHDRIREWNARRLFRRVTTVANDTDYLRRMGMDAAPAQGLFSEVSPGVWFIPNCVDPERFFQPDGSIEGACVPGDILVPRQLCVDRGILLAIEAFVLLLRKRPDCRLVIMGKASDPAYAECCRERARATGAGDRIVFQPPVANRDMPGVYRRAMLTLIPTLRREGTSLSALESMACGVPVVATDIAGLKDLPAFHCRADAADMARAIDDVLQIRDSEARRQYRAVCDDFGYSRWAGAWRGVIGGMKTE